MRRRAVLPLLAAGLSGCGTNVGKMVGQAVSDTAERTGALFKPAEKRRYANPVIAGGHADPSVCRVGEDYFLVASSFEYFPALALQHSRDLIHWHVVGRALEREGPAALAEVPSGQGVLAPSLRWHGGRFHLLATCMGGAGSFLTTARQANGPWSEPVWIQGLDAGVTPALFIDAQGKAWVVHDGGERTSGIYSAELDLDTGRLRGAAQLVWSGRKGVAPMKPVLFSREGWFYLLCTEGRLWDQGLSVARSRSVTGPYEPCFDNPILSHRNLALEPWQMLAHGEPLQAANGAWWLFLQGARLAGRATPLGREVLLAPLQWGEDGWPIVNERKPLTPEMSVEQLPPTQLWPVAPKRDDFKGPGLGPEWQFLRGLAPGLWDLSERPGWLRLKGSAMSLADVGTPAFVGHRQTALAQRATTLLDFAPLREGQQAGMAVRRDEANHALLRVTGTGPRRVELLARIKGQDSLVASRPLQGPAAFGAVRLRVDAYAERYDFSFAGETDDWQLLGSLLPSVLAAEGSETGLRMGLFANGPGAMPPADFDWFEMEAL